MGYLSHRIDTLFRFQFSHADNVASVGGKLAAQKVVDKVNLPDHVDEVKHFADKEANGIEIVIV